MLRGRLRESAQLRRRAGLALPLEIRHDEYTVDIVTDEPNPIVPESLAFLHLLPPAYYTEVGSDGFSQAPVGTGPFVFTEWEKGIHIKLKANPDYWGGAPKLEEVTFKPGPEATTRVAMLETGEADLISNVPPELINRIGLFDA